MHYDVTLKELLQSPPHKLIELLTGSTVAEMLAVEFPSVKARIPDLVLRLADGRILHLEIQSSNSKLMIWRMLEYYWLLWRRFKQPPVQIVLYVGREPLAMEEVLDHPTLSFAVRVIDIRDLAAGPLLDSDRVEDNLIGMLCREGARARVVRRIIGRMGALDEKQRLDRLAQLLILSELRGIQSWVTKETKRMPIEIDFDKSPVFGPIIRKAERRGIRLGKERGKKLGEERGIKLGEERGIKLGEERGIKLGEQRGEQIGQSHLLLSLLEARFGRLPKWAAAKLNTADTATLQRWGIKLLDAKRLEDVIPKSSNGR